LTAGGSQGVGEDAALSHTAGVAGPSATEGTSLLNAQWWWLTALKESVFDEKQKPRMGTPIFELQMHHDGSTSTTVRSAAKIKLFVPIT